MEPSRIVLLHGAATTGEVWSEVASWLRTAAPGVEIVSPTRPSTGSLEAELAWLTPTTEGALLVGVSGGATLALALAASECPFAAAIAHEPAVGSLVPELLEPMVAALHAGGPRAFGAALYGEAWDEGMLGDPDAVARDLEMFRSFEPAAPRDGQGPVLVTYGADSPALRELAARRLGAVYGYPIASIPGARHFLQRESPAAIAELALGMLAGLRAETKG